MALPLIGITTPLRDAHGTPQAVLNASYIEAVQQAGGAPLPLPPQLSPDALASLMERLAGLVLTGGGDVAPVLYGEQAHERVAGVSGARDALETAAIAAALERQLPILAICRGMQILNVVLGGSLYQDIPSQIPGALAHSVQQPRRGPAHTVAITPGSRLACIAGASTIDVNSRHHQSVNRLGEGLNAVANAPDGVVEALELPGDQFVIGVQWHPEDMTGVFESARQLFAAFLVACRA